MVEFWISRPGEVGSFLATTIREGGVRCIAASAGKRPVWSVTYGHPVRGEGTTNFSAGRGAGSVDSHLGEVTEEGRSVIIVGGTHGAEMEGIVGTLNLMHVIEKGTDLRGRGWPRLRALARAMRLIIVPSHNPDGRARVKPASLVGCEHEVFRYWAQGRWKNGELIGYPDCKRYQPLPLDRVAFPGGYPNDAGYNLMHDVALSGPCSEENCALLGLIERERPDAALLLHSHESGPVFVSLDPLVPEAHRKLQGAMASAANEDLAGAGLRPAKPPQTPRGPLFNLATACYATSGAVPLLFEGPHGLERNPYTHEEILEIQLTMFRTVLREVASRPVSNRVLNA